MNVNLSNGQLFSETQGRYIVIAKEGQTLDIDNAVEIGSITDNGQFNVANNDIKVSREVSNLNEIWEGAIPKCMTSVD